MNAPNANFLLVLHELEKVRKSNTKTMQKNLQRRINARTINLDDLLKNMTIVNAHKRKLSR